MNPSPLIELSLFKMLVSFTLVAAALAVSLRQRLGLARTMLWGTFRTVVQLIAVGYVVHVLFTLNDPLPVLAVLAVMLGAAAWTATGRQPLRRMPLLPLATGSLAIGAGLTVVMVVVVIVGARPWYDPRYLIPLSGMILGNAMNAMAIGLERLERELRDGRRRVEAVLALGGSPSQAAAAPERHAMRAALTPIMNSMMIVGLVQLPGIMTGQILAGADPLTAVRYQALVMFMLLSGNSLSAAIAVRRARRRYFTPAWQLALPR
jgi:putative ABC transport system permease protein